MRLPVRMALAAVLGGIAVLGMAPFNLWPVMFITFPLVILLIDGAAAGRWGGLAAAAARPSNAIASVAGSVRLLSPAGIGCIPGEFCWKWAVADSFMAITS